MRLKSFHGPNLTDAMRMVREALGDDAIIVATRDDDMGGVRVTAAIEDIEPVRVPTPALAAATKGGTDAIDVIAEALARHHTPPNLAERLLATATQFASDDPLLSLGAAFDSHLEFQPISDELTDKPLIFVGPPGAGKTVSIAKLATKLTLLRKQITVISTDTERAGGMEQLAAFTRLLKLNLLEIEDAHALRDMVYTQRGSHIILVDTAGRNPFVQADRNELSALVTAGGAEAILVLPAGMDGTEAIDMAQEFRSLGATRILLTRLDITRKLGSVLRFIFESRMPLANFCMSGKVTEPPLPFNPVALAKLVLRTQDAVGAEKQEKPVKKSAY